MKKEIYTQWPDGLTLVASALQSGLNLREAILTLVQEGPDPLKSTLQSQVGKDHQNVSTEQLVERLFQDPSLALAKAAILLSIEAGGEASSVLKTSAALLRQRIEMEGRVRVATAQARLTAWVVGLSPFFFLLFICLMAPAMMRVFLSTPIGWLALGLIFILTSVGLVVVRRMARLDA